MRKTYLARRNALFSSARLSAGAYALFFALAFLTLRLAAPDAFAYAAAPLLQASHAANGAVAGFFASFGERSALVRENEELRTQNAALAAENQALRMKERAVASLALSAQSLVAGVIARPPVSPYDTLLVEGGKEEGVTLGMRAFGPGGVPLGVVSEVLAHTARITLFSASGSTHAGWVGEIPIQVEGAGGGAFVASAPRAAGVAVGDVVYLPGPGQLPVGRVVRVDSDPALSGVTLQIQGAVNLFSLSWVELRDAGVPLGITTP